MGKQSTDDRDMAISLRNGEFTAVGRGVAFAAQGGRKFNVTLGGTWVGTVALERSFDGGTTWHQVSADAIGTPAAWSAPVSLIVEEPELGVLYSLRCSAHASGTVNWRLSQ